MTVREDQGERARCEVQITWKLEEQGRERGGEHVSLKMKEQGRERQVGEDVSLKMKEQGRGEAEKLESMFH